MKREIILFAFAMFLAGTIAVFGTQTHLDALAIVFFRCLIGGICLGVYCWYKGMFKRANFPAQEVRYVALGGVALIVNWVLIFQAFQITSITIGIVSYYTEPFFLMGLGMLILKERQRLSALGWTAVAFAGLVMIILANPVSGRDGNTLLGVMCAMSAAASFALATILSKKVVTMPPAMVTFVQLVIGTVMLLPLVKFSEIFSGQVSVGWGYMLALGTVHTAFLYLVFYQSVRQIPTGLIAPLSFIDPLVTILSDVVVYATVLSAPQIAGIAAILLAAYFVSRPQSRAMQVETA